MNGTSDILSSVGMLTRGINLPGIEVGVLMTLQKNIRDTIQKLGRVLRSTDPVVYIPFIKNSDDQKTLFKLLESYGGNVTII